MKCSCGAIDSATQDDYQTLCKECGIILDNSYLEANELNVGTWCQFENIKPSGQAYKNFSHFYYCVTLELNTPKSITEQGFLLLPQLWENFKYKQYDFKHKLFIALIYSLYTEQNRSIALDVFLKKTKVSGAFIGHHILLVKDLFNFKSKVSLSNRDEEFFSCINEIVSIMFLKGNPKYEKETEKLAKQLAHLIHEKQWVSNSCRSYASVIAACSCTIAGRHVLSQQDKNQKGKRMNFKMLQLDYQKISKTINNSARTVQNFIKTILEELFAVCKQMPWKPKNIKLYTDVPYILPDIISFCDVSTDDIEELPLTTQVEPPVEICKQLQAIVVKAMHTLLVLPKENIENLCSDISNNKDACYLKQEIKTEIDLSKYSVIEIDKICLYLQVNCYSEIENVLNYKKNVVATDPDSKHFLEQSSEINQYNTKQQQRSNNRILKDSDLALLFSFVTSNTVNSDIDTRCSGDYLIDKTFDDKTKLCNVIKSTASDIKNVASNTVVAAKNSIIKADCGSISLGDFELSFQYLDLVKDLLVAGCPLADILGGKYVSLAQEYLDGKALCDDSLPLIDEADIDSYIRSEEEVLKRKEIMRTICKMSEDEEE